ncbi:hypothetical protein NGRA_2677 [Nosema granulosis]|uniref:ISXO2-like transposase domain-containing protein n=1 Tax=Nosema granulosis TaxID=83296 RepID=A0A9P6GWN3_9MICR|nr:hypothetical protein NGRA_2677 [Nosema granulosis]
MQLGKFQKLLLQTTIIHLKIGGNNLIVEIDESKFRKSRFHRGHHVEGVWVLGIVEKDGPKRIKLFRVDDRSKITLEKYIVNSVHIETKIYTDCWKEYTGLKNLLNDHSTVNHSKYFKVSITHVHTNTIEGNWFAVKRQTPPRGRTKKTFDLYLVRFILLRNEIRHPLQRLIKYCFYFFDI